jgi:chemotaxis protein CheX
MIEDFQDGAAAMVLPPVLDLVTASALLEAFLERRGQKLVVDGAAVQRLGGQCLQVLLAARAAWAGDHQDFYVENCSEEFAAALELLGVEPAKLSYRKDLEA